MWLRHYLASVRVEWSACCRNTQFRTTIEHITVVHLSVSAEYTSGGTKSAEQLLLRLLREVRRSTRRMKGVRRLELFYIKERTTSNRWREAKALA